MKIDRVFGNSQKPGGLGYGILQVKDAFLVLKADDFYVPVGGSNGGIVHNLFSGRQKSG